jgi:hypothetical protein
LTGRSYENSVVPRGEKRRATTLDAGRERLEEVLEDEVGASSILGVSGGRRW